MCAYCDDKCKSMGQSHLGIDVYVYDWQLCVYSRNIDIEIEINYCPMCGRKLEEGNGNVTKRYL